MRRVDPLLGTCALDTLRQRRSMKWRTYPADVLPAFVAEMDFDLAQPVIDAATPSSFPKRVTSHRRPASWPGSTAASWAWTATRPRSSSAAGWHSARAAISAARATASPG